MKIFKNILELRQFIKDIKNENKTIGFVPTMGYLHEGHISLVKKSKQENDITVVSIYVNPTQFGPGEDFSKYPRDTEKDTDTLKHAGVDVLFLPNSEEMYPMGYQTHISVKELEQGLCGRTRSGHFSGVATIVCKFFNIITPNKAYFGQKDAQQVAIIKRMVNDLNMYIEIIVCPIVREEDGVAMSSRNTYLNIEERRAATVLYKSLCGARSQIEKGERNTSKIIETIKDTINSEKIANIEYIEIVDCDTLEERDEIIERTLIALAVKIGSTRLIDNIIL